MAKFLAVYTGTPGGPTPDQATIAKGMQAWNDWMAKHAASVVEGGGPLGKTKRADAKGVSDVRNDMAAYVIVQAETHEAAAKLFVNHPHFTIFPGEAVDIMECLPIPGTAR